MEPCSKFTFAIIVTAVLLTSYCVGQQFVTDYADELQCPRHWIQYGEGCYRFIKSPLRDWRGARRNCQAYNADLAAPETGEEHGFLVGELQKIDPQHRLWYVGVRQRSPGVWVVERDNKQLINMDPAFLEGQTVTDGRNFLAYSFSDRERRWGLLKVTGDASLLFICKVPIRDLNLIFVDDDRGPDYGAEKVYDERYIERGPYFMHQPNDTVFDLSRNQLRSDDYVEISCLAGGYPTPVYEWYKEEFENDKLMSKKIDPLLDARYTLSGGTLIIHEPNQQRDRGNYHCVASNKFGHIVSETVQLSFGYIGEFILKRSPETGNQNWGKAIYCDPPQFYPDVLYYWARDYFPNFVEEDPRVFVSYDGNLYISSLDNIDRGRYSCNVQSTVSNTGRNGPFFHLEVLPHSNYQQLKFPNNFPKAFPDSPRAGQDVRLECVAFGYPVASYNWTRRGSPLPRGTQITNYNRILIISNVQVEDQGEYICRAYNQKVAIESPVTLSIQAEPVFTIPLGDQHVDKGSNITWTCEAFGIPDVSYEWFLNGRKLIHEELPYEEQRRYRIQDNVLTIQELDPERDPAMFQCKAYNSLAARYSSGQLRVLTLAPTFTKTPLDTETLAAIGGNVTIECNPEAAPHPKFTWRKDGNMLGSGGRRRILPNGNLIISPVSTDDRGTYTCIAENMYGDDRSSGRLIVLQGPRMIRYPPSPIITSVDSRLDLQCWADANVSLDMALIWTQNSIRIQHDENPRLVVFDHNNTLSIINITERDAGQYECILETAVGQAKAETIVVVYGPPGPPGAIQAFALTDRSAILRWADGTSNGDHIRYYVVEGRTNWNRTWRVLARHLGAVEIDRQSIRKEAELRDVLSPWASYEFRIRAGNSYGYGPPSEPSPQYNTGYDIPYVAPRKVGGGGGKTGDLTLTWEPLPTEEQNAPGIHYRIFWRRYEPGYEREYQNRTLKEQGNIGLYVVAIQRQFFYTQYEVKVQAINDQGPGPVSLPAVIYSAEDMPQVAPAEVYSRGYNATALNVTWKPVEREHSQIRGELIGHRIKYWRKDDDEANALYLLNRATYSWALVVGLQPDTFYWVRAMVYNSAGQGPESERFLERTFKKPPQKQPSGVFVKAVNPSTVKVTWRYVAPSVDEEPLIGYKVRVWESDQDMSQAKDTIVYLGHELETEVTGLSPGKMYKLRVLAYSQGGDGKMSSPAWEFQMGDPEALSGRGTSLCGLSTNLLLTKALFIWIVIRLIL